jgi:CRISPR-associated endonuclease/helicase Cas3
MDEPHARRFVSFLASLHDIGKACPCFQDRWPLFGSADYVEHEKCSYFSLPALLQEFTQSSDTSVDGVAHRMAEIAGAHHGEFPVVARRAVRRAEQEERLGGPAWQARRRDIVDDLRGLLEPTVPSELGHSVAVVLAGLVILADWIVSDVEWISTSQWTAPEVLSERWQFTLRAVEQRILALKLTPPQVTGVVTTSVLLGVAPNPLQRSIENEFRPRGGGILLITAPTAAGKTAAGFVAGHRIGTVTGRPGLMMCLPTQATTNAMWDLWQHFASAGPWVDGRVTMVHGMARFHQDYRQYCASDEALRWLNGSLKPLLVGMSVVTVDQLLLAALAIKFNMLRMLAFTGKTIVIDEIHAYEPYMLTLLARVLSWCGHLGISVVLLSATVPKHVAEELTTAYLVGADPERAPQVEPAAYPGWIWHGSDGSVLRPSDGELIAMHSNGRRKTRIDYVTYPTGSRMSEVLGYATQVEQEGGCVAVICNTVATAQKTFLALQGAGLPRTKIGLLHARLPHSRREEVEGFVEGAFGKEATRANGRRPERGIVVCTPLIEHSLDLDFDLVISDLSPIALLLQRLGRCWRHSRPLSDRPAYVTKPTLVVLDPAGDQMPSPWLSIHSEYELRTTRRLLATSSPEFLVPDDVDALVQQVHHHDLPPFDGTAAAAWRERHATTVFDQGLARLTTVPPPHLIDNLTDFTRPDISDTDATTRLGLDNCVVIPQWSDDTGRQWLDAAHTLPFPRPDADWRTVSPVVGKSVRCPASWVDDLELVPTGWKQPQIRGARILPASGHPRLSIDSTLGLVNGPDHDPL